MNWTISAGSLPPGISIDAVAGVISGIPTASGTFTFTVKAIDASGNSGTKDYVLVVTDTGIPLLITPATLPNGVVGQSYSIQLSAAPAQTASTLVFPADHILNPPIDKAPLLANSAAMIAQISADAGNNQTVHPGFEIPVNEGVYPATTVLFDSADESDPGPYPIPANPQTEGGGDNHLIIRETDTSKIYEIFAYRAGPPAGGLCGASWDLSKYALRTLWNTSADAAGLPIYPLLIRFKEFAAGAINHALRVTVSHSRSFGNYAGLTTPGGTNPPADWPARHRADHTTVDPNVPAMGQRLRLKASFDDSGLSAPTRIITAALKKYGFIVADAGSSFFCQGDTDPGWTAATTGQYGSLQEMLVTELRNVHIADFEAVDGVGPFIISVDSGQAKQL